MQSPCAEPQTPVPGRRIWLAMIVWVCVLGGGPCIFGQTPPSPDKIPRLTEEAASVDAKVAYAAVQRLAVAGVAGYGGLKASLSSHDRLVSDTASQAFGTLVRSGQVDDRLEQELATYGPAFRVIIHNLVMRNKPGDREILGNVLHDQKDVAKRQYVALQLASMGSDLTEGLRSQMLVDPAPEVRNAAVHTTPVHQPLLTEKNFPYLMRYLAGALGDPDPYIRGNCWRQVQWMSGQGDPRVLEVRLVSQNDDERLSAAVAAGWCAQAHLEAKRMLRSFLKDRSTSVRRYAARSLAMQLTLVEALDLFENSDPIARGGVGDALMMHIPTHMPDERSKSWYTARASSSDRDVRVLALTCLEGPIWGPRNTADASDLIPATCSKVSIVRRSAAASLLRPVQGTTDQRQADGATVVLAVANDPDPDVAADAIRSLIQACGLDGNSRTHGLGSAQSQKLGKDLRCDVIETPAQKEAMIRRHVAALRGLTELPESDLEHIWKSVAMRLDDPEPQIRTAAIEVGRTLMTARWASVAARAKVNIATTHPAQ